jgi:hypothetical protein
MKIRVIQRNSTMKKLNKLYFSLGLLFLKTSVIYSNEECFVNTEIQKEFKDQAQIEAHKIEKIKKETDQNLFDLFERFFNDEDVMPFSKFVSELVSILKIKQTVLHKQQQIECEELIRALERNKDNSSPIFWRNILTTPKILDLMTEEARNYLNNIPTFVKMKSLVNKLINNSKR